MAKYVDKANWEEEVLIPDTSTPVLGGKPLWEGDQFVEGFYNVPIAILADRTRFLKQRVEGVEQEVIEGLERSLVAEENLADIPDPGQAKYNLGLNLVDNTRDIDKPISIPVQEALDGKVDKEVGKGLSENDFSNAYKNKLDGIAPEATKNASDAQLRDRSTHTGTQPISTVTGLQTALDSKVDKVAGMGLSQENYTTAEKNKLSGIEDGATNLVIGTSGTTAKAGDWQPTTASKSQTLNGTVNAFVSGEAYHNIISWASLGSVSSGTLAIDLDTSLNFTVNVGGNITAGNPTNADPGKCGEIVITMTANGSVSWAANWKFLNDVPDIGDNGDKWVVSYKVLDTSNVLASASKLAS